MKGASEEKLASVSNLVTVFENSRTPEAAPRGHRLEDAHHRPECSPPESPGPWEKTNVGEAVGSEPRTVSRRYLNSLKNKLSSGAWRKSCQPVTLSGLGTQEQEKKIVRELLETEQAYVARLHLLDQVFFQELLRTAHSSKAFPEDVVRVIFSNISSIYQFHSQFFLPELQRRLDDWTANPRIGDVIQKLAPFLKMYSEYVKNFERAAELLATWTDKSPLFQEVLTRIQGSEASGSLTLQHHMLEPVQRIPRYELLLKEYVQKLPAQAPDRADAQKALDMIFSAAQHSNAAITEMERLQDLWEVYQRLGLEDDIVDPSNTLLREGPVLKISFRRNDPMERYLFLFNNMLLYCVPRVIQVSAQFQVRTRIDVAGMKVRELMDAEFPHSFLVSGKQRTLELQARSQEEMISWMQAFQAAIDQIEKRNETFKAAAQGPEGDTQEQELQSEELGLRAPQWVRDKMVTMCMRCQEPFNALTRRRHHCRACGYVVCARCSDYRAELKYDDNRPNRVCLHCYTFLTGNVLPEAKEDKRRGILEKGSSAMPDQSLMCSFLQLIGDKWGKSGPRGWCVIPRDDPLVLYVYAAPQDMRAHTSIPLLGYQVTVGPQGDPRVFQLQQSGQLYTFKAETEELKGRWVKAMERAASGWSPSWPNDGDLSD
ncbi:FYVE, RhoGEF and PH domain-containing protein 2 isoform X1 [Symphalangus syndactylus]|uniref:FYVE, RhoGEF and PH domain-containing protein 2 isoform X1 n=1 Tax=Symphalangus syndactylus TaxID=9590 RepID=UPI002442C8CD|nr:FYVE, RhoGEF and PH domain-containing protein 2 [Symphalangus syndactylus]